MTAIFEIDDNIEMNTSMTFRVPSVSPFVCSNISPIPRIPCLTARCHLKAKPYMIMMAAILEIGGHIKNRFEHSNSICIIRLIFYMLKHITYHLKLSFESFGALLMQNGITWQWQPSWQLAAILKWSRHSNSCYIFDCTFCMLKALNLFSKWPFRPFAAILRQNCKLEIRKFVPNLVLVSYFERFLHWSAALYFFSRLVWLFCMKYTLMYPMRKYRILEYCFCVECGKFVVG